MPFAMLLAARAAAAASAAAAARSLSESSARARLAAEPRGRLLRLAALTASFAATAAAMTSPQNEEKTGERRREGSQQRRQDLPFLAASPAEQPNENPGNETAASFPARALMALSSAVADAAASVASSSSSSRYESTYREFPLPLDKLRCLRRARRKKADQDGDGDGGAAADEHRREDLALLRRRRPVVLVACGSFNPPTIAHLRMFRVAEEALRRKKKETGDGGTEVLGGFLSPAADAYSATRAAAGAKAASLSRAPAEDRRALCRVAAESDPRAPLAVDEWESRVGQRQGAPVRTLRVLQAVEARLAAALREAEEEERAAGGKKAPLPPLPPPRAVLLCGEDLLASMAAPGVWDAGQVEEIAREHGLVCVLREPSSSVSIPDPDPDSSPSASSSSPPPSASRSHPRARTLLSPGGPLAHLSGLVTLVEDPADLRGVSSTLAREELRREEEGREGGGVRGGSWLVPPAVAEEARRRGLYRC